MTLSLELTGYDPNNPVPADLVEVRFAQGETGGDKGLKKVLIMAPSTSAGSITQDTEVFGPISTEDEAITKTGSGSCAHRMVREFLRVCKNVQLYVICPTRSGGTAASATIVYSGTITAVGVAKVRVCGEPVYYAYTTSDTATTVGAGIAAAINALTYLPVTAANVTGTVTLTAKNAGPDGNTIRIKSYVPSGTGLASTSTSLTALSSGATEVDYTTALTTIASQKYHRIVAHTTDYAGAGAVEDIQTQIGSQALPATGIRQQVFFGLSGTSSDLVTKATGINDARMRIIWMKNAWEENYVLAAKVAASFCNHELSDPSYNFDGYGLKSEHVFTVYTPENVADIPTNTTLATVLANGGTPIGVTANGATYVVRSITSRSLNGATQDYRARDSHRVSVADAFADDLLANMANAPYSAVTEDPATGGKEPLARFITPKRAKTIVEDLIRAYNDAGHMDPAKLTEMLESISTGIDPGDASRINVIVKVKSVNLKHKSASLVAESSPAT